MVDAVIVHRSACCLSAAAPLLLPLLLLLRIDARSFKGITVVFLLLVSLLFSFCLSVFQVVGGASTFRLRRVDVVKEVSNFAYLRAILGRLHK